MGKRVGDNPMTTLLNLRAPLIYNFRGRLSQVTRIVATQAPAFKGLTDMEPSTIPNRSIEF